MIEVSALSRYYGTMTAVDQVSFSIEKNEIVGLLGHNGAGKTTIMRMLSGCLEPSSGEIVMDGKDLGLEPKGIQQQLGYLPESLPLYPEMIVGDYLEYAATLKNIPAANRLRRVQEALAATDLQSRAIANIGTLSRGLKQRLGVAQAILGKPRLLILDEPTNGLDPMQTQQMRELIQRLARRATVVLSTHILQEVEAICDRVLVLRNGQLVLDETLDSLRRATGIRLLTDAAAPPLLSALESIPGVAALTRAEEHDGAQRLELALEEDADARAISGAITSRIQATSVRLLELSPMRRELDQVIAELNEHGD